MGHASCLAVVAVLALGICVPALAAEPDLEMIGKVRVRNGGTGAVDAASARNNLGIGPGVSITDFGARCNGAADDAPAIQAAIRYGAAHSVPVHFPVPEGCLIDTPITGDGSGPVTLVFDNTTLIQRHTGTGITLAQSNLGHPVRIFGNVNAVAGMTSASASFLSVSFPTAASWALPTFDAYGKIACRSQSGTVSAPYPETYTNCLTLEGTWGAVSYGLHYVGPALASGVLAGTSAVKLTGAVNLGPGFYNLVAYNVDAAVITASYSEGIYLVEPGVTRANYGVKIGAASINAAGAYTGTHGITQTGGLNCNLLKISGGSMAVYRTALFADTCQEVTTTSLHSTHYGYDGTNPYRPIILVDTLRSWIDGMFSGQAGGATGETAFYLVNNAGVTQYNRIRGIVRYVLTGATLAAATANNDAELTISDFVTTPITDSGTSNSARFASAGTTTVSSGKVAVSNTTASTTSTTGAVVITGGLGVGGAITTAGAVNSTGAGFIMNGATIAADAGGTYHHLYDKGPAQNISMGYADPNNYYNNTGHKFQSRGGAVVYTSIEAGRTQVGLTTPQHLTSGQTTAPALTSCGTGSPAIVGTDTAGTVTMGTTATGCVITFNVAYAAAPHCVGSWPAQALASQSYVTAAGSITLTQTSASGNKFVYVCVGQSGG